MSSPARRSEIVIMLISVYQSGKAENTNDSKELLQLLLRIVIANQQFVDYKDIFQPIRHAFTYNLELIDRLIEIGDFRTAESYCNEQIQMNTNGEYDWSYISRLKHIYTQTKDQQKLILILSKILLKTPDFEDYKLVVSHLPHDAEFKKWRNMVLANARQLAIFDKKSADFSLALRHSEGDVKGMIAYLDDKIDYECITLYAKELLDQSPELFIKKLLEKPDAYRDIVLREDDNAKLNHSLEKLYSLTISKFGTETMLLMVKQIEIRYRSWVNLFVKYAIEKL
ncbi:hypothetical protein SAMN05443550_10165 [Pedobacter hartonius]|uniref:Uncharacterized protein n=2 Tax=Pedobacter hartonius TaxID=425514 RepID=A0A1H3W264_9SPHI|nr:hypothetical protein SAMN05443550_10165 [Pedobacter hartonius]